jgi:hypothetical protein
MSTTMLSQRMGTGFAATALSILVAPAMQGHCSAGARNGGTSAPELRSLPEVSEPDQKDP